MNRTVLTAMLFVALVGFVSFGWIDVVRVSIRRLTGKYGTNSASSNATPYQSGSGFSSNGAGTANGGGGGGGGSF